MKKVLTFGVFDILHIGHIQLFKNAKALGDKLIVAVQDSEYVKRTKPNAKLVYTTQERLFMVHSVKYVDEVITYSEIDKTITEIDFDIFAKGPDQNHSGFQNAIKWCIEHEKEIVIIPRTEGTSSTILRQYLKDND